MVGLKKIATIRKPKESKIKSMHSSSCLDNYHNTESKVMRGDTEDGRVNRDMEEMWRY